MARTDITHPGMLQSFIYSTYESALYNNTNDEPRGSSSVKSLIGYVIIDDDTN